MGSSSDSSSSGSSSSSDESEEEPPLPAAAVKYLDEVGDLFLGSSGLAEWFQRRHGKCCFSSDCSGADAPFLALRYLFEAANQGHSLVHLSASEIHPSKRQFLKQNFNVQQLTESVLKQDNTLLSNGVCLLENVMGFKIIADKVATFIMVNCPGYRMVYVALNPRRYGAPISRKRIFLIMVREDCLASDVQNYDFGDFIQGKLDGMKLPASKVGWNDLLLPSEHPAVRADVSKRNQRRLKAMSMPVNKKAKWVKRHREWAKQHQVDVQKVNKEKLFAKKHPSAAKQITSYRELEACNLLAAKHSSLAMINTSQNLGHISVLECTSEELFCLTPQGKFLATGRGRYLLGRETMLLMGLPVHRLNLKGCSENVGSWSFWGFQM
ncbi:unnamed protein product [Cladocopium goreaui]|uniref:Modification methylase NlaIV n=1 Tax=Cladocopium goreaui TaxID=2562237 RepID=A0A9P1DCL7_9DINO|nr:unnamed protein product [Cladocopium goreaui]